MNSFLCSWGKKAPYIFSKFNLVNTDIFYGPLGVCINGVWLYGEIIMPLVLSDIHLQCSSSKEYPP